MQPDPGRERPHGRRRRSGGSLLRRRLSARHPGRGLNGCTDVELIAAGTTSQVFRAWQPAMARQVAIKVLTGNRHDPRGRARFERELAMTRRLSGHPFLVSLFDHGLTRDGVPYLVMPWYGRGSLADELRREGPLPVASVLALGVRIGLGLAHAHEAGVVHRDVKPTNVLVDAHGEAVLTDFGGAVRLDELAAATTVLTPMHAAPELLCGAPASAAADVWSLASTLYTVLEGQPPFALGSAGGGLVQDLDRLLHAAMPLPTRHDVPPQLTALLAAGLAKAPADRPSATDFVASARRIQSGLGLPVTPLPVTPGPDRPGARPLPALPVDDATVLRPPAGAAVRPRFGRLAVGVGGALVGGAAAAVLLSVGVLPLDLLGPTRLHSAPAGAQQSAARPSTTTDPVARPSTTPDAAALSVIPAAAGSAAAGGRSADAAGALTAATSLVVTDRGQNSISLRWQDTNQGRTGYLVLVDPVQGQPFGQPARTVTAHTVIALRPGSRYCFRTVSGPATVAPVSAQVCTSTLP